LMNSGKRSTGATRRLASFAKARLRNPNRSARFGFRSRARVLGYQFVPFLCFAGPERIILVFELRALTAESGHCAWQYASTSIRHFPRRSNAKCRAHNVPAFVTDAWLLASVVLRWSSSPHRSRGGVTDEKVRRHLSRMQRWLSPYRASDTRKARRVSLSRL